jgi:FkbM family methyltransferase
MRSLVKKLLNSKGKERITSILKKLLSGSADVRLYFSQSGEDIQIYNILRPDLHKGTYVDVGSFHPTHLSNTHLLYMNGWQGLNIDANPGSMLPFKKIRPRDKNVEIGVSDKEETLSFYRHSSKAMSSFEPTEGAGEKVELRTKPLNNLLEENHITNIDVLTVDAEGFDYRILKAFTFEKYTPKLIVVEQVCNDIEEILQTELYQLLKKNGYAFVARTIVGDDVGSSIYKRCP